jgi:hypothetical protein
MDTILGFSDSKYSLFDVDYAIELANTFPEIWSIGGGAKSDNVFEVLIKIHDQGGIALTPDEVEVLELRESWIQRHKNDAKPMGIVAQIKWLAVSSDGEAFMKKTVNIEVSKMYQRANYMETKGHKQPIKDPHGGLTAAGRKFFNRTQGAHLKPGVRGPANSPEKMRRKGSFLTRFFTNPSGPMKDEKGNPTRLALSASAWGEPVPQNMEDAARLAEKGRSLLERYRRVIGNR